MSKRLLLMILVLGVLFSTQTCVIAVDYQDTSIHADFGNTDRGYPYRWTVVSRGEMSTAPVLCDIEADGEQEIIMLDNLDGLLLVHAENGTQIWNYDPDPNLDVQTRPVASDLDNDSVLDIVVSSYKGLMAVDGGTAATLWRNEGTNYEMQGRVVTIDGFSQNGVDDILYRFNNNSLALFRGDTGDQLWKTSNQTILSPLAVESVTFGEKDVLTIEYDGVHESLVLLNGSNGDVIWKEYEGASFNRQPIVTDLTNDDRLEVVFGCDSPAGENIIALDASNGTTIWTAMAVLTHGYGNMIAGDVNHDGVLDIVVDQGLTNALDGNDGSLIWTFSSSADHLTIGMSNLTGSAGMEVVVRDAWYIHALDAESGKPVWSSNVPNTNGVETADFDGDMLDEVITVSYSGESYVLDGSDGGILWFLHTGGTTQSMQVVGLGKETPISVLYASTYFVSIAEITNLNPNTQMTLTVVRFLPLTVGIVMLILLPVLWKKEKLNVSVLYGNRRISNLWKRILRVDSSSWKFKVLVWVTTIVSPWVWVTPSFDTTVRIVLAPVWSVFSRGALYPNYSGFSILGFTNAGLQPSGAGLLFSLASPLIVSAIILELESRRLVAFRMPRKLVIGYVVVVAGAGLWLWASGTWLIAVPIPIAAITLLIADSIVRQSLPEIQISQKIQAWLCPVCAAKLPETAAIELKEGKTVVCPFCGVTMNLGAALAIQNRRSEAEAAFRRATKLNPKYAPAWSNLGVALEQQSRYQEAEAAFRRATELDPRLAPAWSGLGAALGHQNRHSEAEAACRRAIELNPGLAEAWSNLGEVLTHQNRYREAEAAFRRATELDPRLAQAWSGLGAVFYFQKRRSEAETAFRRAIELDPTQRDMVEQVIPDFK